MGACASAKTNYQQNIGRTNSIEAQRCGLGNELVESPQKEPPSPERKRTVSTAETGVMSSAESAQKPNSVISLSEALMKSNLDLGDEDQGEDLKAWIEERNTPSSIIMLSKSGRKSKGRQESGVKRSQSLVDTFERCEKIDGELKANGKMQKIVITNLEIDVEFMLSKCRAGPLVVPYITYDQYCTN